MKIKEMRKKDAKNICDWEYNLEYSVYNVGGYKLAKKNKWAIADKYKRNNQFKSVFNENNQLIGYFRFIEEENSIKLGLGMHPSLCGMGNGKKFLECILNEKELKNKIIKLEVRKFNKRAIKCYEKVGFKIIDKNDKFIIMVLDNKKSD